MKIEKMQQNQRPPPSAEVTVKECGNVAEVRHSLFENRKQNIHKIDKEYYIIPSEETGELHKFSHNENRLDDRQSLRESLSRLRDYL